MTIDDKTKDENLRYNFNSEAAKISALSSGKIDKYEYLIGEEILPPGQSRKTEPAKFTYSPLSKTFEKQENNGKTRKKASRSFKSIETRGK